MNDRKQSAVAGVRQMRLESIVVFAVITATLALSGWRHGSAPAPTAAGLRAAFAVVAAAFAACQVILTGAGRFAAVRGAALTKRTFWVAVSAHSVVAAVALVAGMFLISPW